MLNLVKRSFPILIVPPRLNSTVCRCDAIIIMVWIADFFFRQRGRIFEKEKKEKKKKEREKEKEKKGRKKRKEGKIPN